MHTIWKFQLKPEGEFSIEMPKGAKLLRIGEQGIGRVLEDLVLWAVVDPDDEKVKRRFRLMGTGHSDTERLLTASYVDTVQMRCGLVFHLFDLGEEG